MARVLYKFLAMLAMLAVTVSGKPKTYLIETADNIDNPVTLSYVYKYIHTLINWR